MRWHVTLPFTADQFFDPAAWSFSAVFVAETVLLVWFGVLHDRLAFSPVGSPRHFLHGC
jgi:hypothetical protein